MAFCLHQIVSNAARRCPYNTAIIEQDRFITYKKLNEEIGSASYYLLNEGLKKGEKVGLISRNSIDFVIAYFAILRAGGVTVPINHTLDICDITARTTDCSVAALYAGEDFEEKAKLIRDKTKSVRFIMKRMKYSPRIAEKKVLPRIKAEDLASIVYTSGTTGKPLGVMLSNKNLIANNKSIVKYMRLTNKNRICCVLPFYYIYGLSLLFSHFLAGGAIIIENRFLYPNTVLDTIDRCRATGFAGVSSHYAILLYRSDLRKRRLSSLKYFMQAGDAMPVNLTKELMNIFPDKKFYIMYGQTEASPRLTFLDPSLAKAKPHSIGKAIPGVKIKIMDKTGSECRIGESGEIVAKGDNIMQGYWKNKKETSKTLKGGWLHTGDIAFKDKNGDLFIVGRANDFIKTGGNKINPLDIARAILEDRRIMEAVLIDIPDIILGSGLKLFVTIVPGAFLSKKDILNICKSRLPRYALPSEIVILTSMPKNSYGKIDKKVLLELR